MSKKCPESVPKVSKRCPGNSGDTLGTRFGYSRARTQRAPETLCGTLPWTPRFSGTLSGTLPETLWARTARETPVAGWGVRNPRKQGFLSATRSRMVTLIKENLVGAKNCSPCRGVESRDTGILICKPTQSREAMLSLAYRSTRASTQTR